MRRAIAILLLPVLATGFLLAGVAGETLQVELAPGTTQTYTCPTELSGSWDAESATLVCASEPPPAPTATPEPTTAPTPAPTAMPTPLPTASPQAGLQYLGTGPLAAGIGSDPTLSVQSPTIGSGATALLACQGRRNTADFSAAGFTSLYGPAGPSGLRLEVLTAPGPLSGSVTVSNADPINGWSCSISAFSGIGSLLTAAGATGSGGSMAAPQAAGSGLVTRWYASSDDFAHSSPSEGELAFTYPTDVGVDHASSMAYATGSAGTASMEQAGSTGYAAATLVFDLGAPTPTATPVAGGCDASGIARPPLTSGMFVWGELDFCETTTLGDGYSATTLQLLQPRPNVAQDCTFPDSSGRGRYCAGATTSEHDGVLDQWLHTETGACSSTTWTFVHDPNGGCNYVSGPKWTLPDQDEFAVSFIALYEDIPGRKIAHLRWCGPPVGAAGYCEDNLPEAKLEAGPRGFAFHHLESSSQQTSYPLGADDNGIELDEWHLFQLVVRPCVSVTFIVDGHVEGHTTTGVTCDPSYYVFQAETYLANQALPLPHREGHLYLDWVRIEAG